MGLSAKCKNESDAWLCRCCTALNQSLLPRFPLLRQDVASFFWGKLLAVVPNFSCFLGGMASTKSVHNNGSANPYKLKPKHNAFERLYCNKTNVHHDWNCMEQWCRVDATGRWDIHRKPNTSVNGKPRSARMSGVHTWNNLTWWWHQPQCVCRLCRGNHE